jgi:hypothetical protein
MAFCQLLHGRSSSRRIIKHGRLERSSLFEAGGVISREIVESEERGRANSPGPHLLAMIRLESKPSTSLMFAPSPYLLAAALRCLRNEGHLQQTAVFAFSIEGACQVRECVALLALGASTLLPNSPFSHFLYLRVIGCCSRVGSRVIVIS